MIWKCYRLVEIRILHVYKREFQVLFCFRMNKSYIIVILVGLLIPILAIAIIHLYCFFHRNAMNPIRAESIGITGVLRKRIEESFPHPLTETISRSISGGLDLTSATAPPPVVSPTSSTTGILELLHMICSH